MTILLGLDISTTGAKALAIDAQGKVIASHNTPQPISQPKPLWSEQHPADWWAGMAESLRAVTSQINTSEIKGIGLTGQMHGLVCLDADGNVLRPAILWNDQRTQAQCDEITATIGAERLIQLTGNRALTGFTAPKVLWVRQNEPAVYTRIAHILLPKDYIRYKLTGEYATDLAGAAGTLLLNVADRQWSQEVIHALDIPSEWLPTTHEGHQVTGVTPASIIDETGLPTGIPVVGGGGDQAAGAVGMGAVEPGIIGLTVGTSGVVFAPLGSYAYEPEGRLHAFCHALPNQWHFMGVMLSAAGSLQWYRDTLAPAVDFATLINEAAEAPAGSDGLLFLPYLTGERTPHPDPLARGAFVGLTTRHTRAHLTRAVLEGVAFGLRDCFELIQGTAAGKDISEIRVSGGGTQSTLWRQILADVLGNALFTVDTSEGGALGAALLAGLGSKQITDIQVNTIDVIDPGSDQSVYHKLHQQYQALYPRLNPVFHAL